MLCHRDRRMTKPVARRPLRPMGYDGMGPSAALALLARLSHQSGNQVIWGSRNWNHEGKGADGAGVSDLWESKRVSCRMVGLRIA